MLIHPMAEIPEKLLKRETDALKRKAGTKKLSETKTNTKDGCMKQRQSLKQETKKGILFKEGNKEKTIKNWGN